MDPLYCFKYDEEHGKVEIWKINNYTEGKQISNKEFYRFRIHGALRYAYKHQLDHCMNNRVYSFDPDLKHALKIMRDAAQAKLVKAKTDATNCEFMLEDLTKDMNRKHQIKEIN